VPGLDSVTGPPTVPIATLPRELSVIAEPERLEAAARCSGVSLPWPTVIAPVVVTAPRQISPWRHPATSCPPSFDCAAPSAGTPNTSAVKLAPEKVAPVVTMALPERAIAPVPAFTVAPGLTIRDRLRARVCDQHILDLRRRCAGRGARR